MAAVRPAGPEPSTATRVEMLLVIGREIGCAYPPGNGEKFALDRPAPGDEVPDQDDDADDQEQVDEASSNVEGEKAERPQDEQDDCDGQEHVQLSSSASRNGGVTAKP